MSTLNPKSRCTLVRRSQTFDLYGRPLATERRRTARCAIVRAGRKAERTSVRNDSSASGGGFEEFNHDARILFNPDEDVREGDLIVVNGLTFEIKGAMLRPDVNGVPHHIQVEADRWVSA